MKYKIWLKISFYSLLFGWFPFMWLSIYGSWNRDVGVYIMLIGLFFCFIGSILMLPLLRNQDLFKSIEELEKERESYHKAVQRLEKKILEI